MINIKTKIPSPSVDLFSSLLISCAKHFLHKNELRNAKNISLLIIFIFSFSCSNDGINNNIDLDKSVEPFHGTYLLKDMNCGGVDLQHL